MNGAHAGAVTNVIAGSANYAAGAFDAASGSVEAAPILY
jgi:hypothetical protein